MARGILGGMVFGSVVSVAAAGTILVVLDPPTRPEAVVEAPANANAPTTAEQQAKSGYGDADLVTDGSRRPSAVPEAEDASRVASAGGDTPTLPETGFDAVSGAGFGAASDVLAEVAQGPAAAPANVPAREPVLPAPQVALPTAPGTEVELSISTEPAQPPAPQVADPLDSVEPATLAAPVAPEAPEGAEEPQIATLTREPVTQGQDVEALPAEPAADGAPVADATSAALPEPVLAEASEDAATPEAQAEDALAAAATPEVQAPAEDAPAGTERVAEQVAPAERETAPSVVADVAVPETPVLEETVTRRAPVAELGEGLGSSSQILADLGARPSVGRPAKSIIDRGQSDAEDLAQSEAEVVPSGPPLQAFAAKFENPADRPLMSVVLIDTGIDLGDAEAGLAALKGVPFPVSFAVDTGMADAAERMKAYRAAGHEVLALMDLPEGATVQDAAVNLDAAFATVPQAVAVIEGPRTGIQTNKDVTDLLISELKSSGHGVVLQEKGLNSAYRDAAREGLSARVVFRDFDSAGQDARTIRRFLEQAAFRARQEGGVIMMGRMRPETISALLTWQQQERARAVAMAPVSAILTQ